SKRWTASSYPTGKLDGRPDVNVGGPDVGHPVAEPDLVVPVLAEHLHVVGRRLTGEGDGAVVVGLDVEVTDRVGLAGTDRVLQRRDGLVRDTRRVRRLFGVGPSVDRHRGLARL